MEQKRVTVKPKKPNPLFEKWLTEWRDKAKEGGSKMQFCFSIALKSLQKYPLPLESGKDCKILNGFGEKLCEMLDNKLTKYNSGELQNEIRSEPSKNSKRQTAQRAPVKTNQNVIVQESETFPILVTLYERTQEVNNPGFMLKADFISKGLNWSSMSALVEKKIVIKQGKPAKFRLTSEGAQLAEKLYIQQKLKEFEDQENVSNSNSYEPLIKITKSTLQKVSRNEHDYIPVFGSGAFAILLTLYEGNQQCNYPGFMLKSDIISKGQRLSNTSFVKPGPDTKYTAWSSMATLVQKNLIEKKGNPAKFSLTEKGRVLGEKLYIHHKIEEFNGIDNKPHCSKTESLENEDINLNSDSKKIAPIWRTVSATSSSSQTSASSGLESVVLGPNSFEIVLLVDNRELSGTKNSAEVDPILLDLKKMNITYEVRSLKVGDYVWICRHNNVELVLPYIVERKRMDDLGSSIKDSRFHEQKFRLKQCGLQNVIYLIENFGQNVHVGLPINTLYQAASNTLLQDGFMVKFTENGRGTCEYLASLTNFLNNFYKAKTLASCAKEDLRSTAIDDNIISLMHFKEFYKSSLKVKNFKLRDMFVKQLLQIKGMSVDKALAVVNKYPTPKNLKLAYKENELQGEKMLSNVRYGILNKNIGPVLSKTVYQFFCNDYYR